MSRSFWRVEHPSSFRLGCPAPAHLRKEDRIVFDLFCLALIVVFFFVAAAFTRGCEALEKEED